jgi:hypothetical protein
MFVSLNKRWSRGYQFMLSYTLSKAIDDGPDALIVTLTSPFPAANDSYSPRQIQFALKYIF